jgi:predicted metal-dependent hydrolase
MIKEGEIQTIKYRVTYSARRTLAISILPDASVIVRVPYRTSDRTIQKLVADKSSWILKHTNNFRIERGKKLPVTYSNGSTHLFRGQEIVLQTEYSSKTFYHISDGSIVLGLRNHEDPDIVKALLYRAYKDQAEQLFPEMLRAVLHKFENYGFRPSKLTVRTMKRRWGSCSNRGSITLNTELIKLPDKYVEYVITHELCHLRHHNHGEGFYRLLSELFPEWKSARKELKMFQVL